MKKRLLLTGIAILVVIALVAVCLFIPLSTSPKSVATSSLPNGNNDRFTSNTGGNNGTSYQTVGGDKGISDQTAYSTYVAGWRNPVQISGPNANASSPHVALSANGMAVAVWTQSEDGVLDLYASNFTPESNWSAPVLLGANIYQYTTDPGVGIYDQGNAMVVWTDQSGEAWFSRYIPSQGWTEPSQICSVGEYDLSVGSSGKAFLIYSDMWYLYVKEFDPSTGWQAADELVYLNSPSAALPQICAGPNGTAFAAWFQGPCPGDYVQVWNVMTSTYTSGGGWSNPVSQGYDGEDFSLAVNEKGEAVVTWFDAQWSYGVWASIYKSGSWNVPVLISNDLNSTVNIESNVASIDADGNALVIWAEQNGIECRMYSNQYTDGKGWGSPRTLDNGNQTASYCPQAEPIGTDEISTLWIRQINLTRSLVVSDQYEQGTGWRGEEYLGDGGGSADISASIDGEAI